MGLLETAAHRLELRPGAAHAPIPGNLAGGFLHQPLRRAALPHLLQGLHGKGVGRALRGNLRRMGRAAHQGTVVAQSARACAGEPVSPPRGGTRRTTGTETSLIERFLYPKFGPGQMWEEVARQVALRGGEVHLNHRVVGIEHAGFKVSAVRCAMNRPVRCGRVPCGHFISTMPVRDLRPRAGARGSAGARIAAGLPYRDFMTAGPVAAHG
jgi:protoporphyrinogen oxidase